MPTNSPLSGQPGQRSDRCWRPGAARGLVRPHAKLTRGCDSSATCTFRGSLLLLSHSVYLLVCSPLYIILALLFLGFCMCLLFFGGFLLLWLFFFLFFFLWLVCFMPAASCTLIFSVLFCKSSPGFFIMFSSTVLFSYLGRIPSEILWILSLMVRKVPHFSSEHRATLSKI